MSERSFEEILDSSLDLLRAGASIEECVAPYPQYAERLRAQLRVAQDLLSARPQTLPAASASAAGRARLLAAAADKRRNSTLEPHRGFMFPLPALLGGRSMFSLLPKAIPAVVAMLVLGGAAWGVSAATTGEAGPGGWFESSSSSSQRIEVRGTVIDIDTASLTITVATADGDVPVQVTAQTQFEDGHGTPLTLDGFVAGDGVKISATRDVTGTLVAHKMEHEDEGDAVPADQPTADDLPVDPTEQPTTPVDDQDGDDDDDNSGPSNGDADDNSGPGNGDDDDKDKDNSGPGGGDDDHDNSGPGSGDEDDEDLEDDD